MSYVVAGYGVTLVVLGGVRACASIRRGRALARALPPEPSPPHGRSDAAARPAPLEPARPAGGRRPS